MIEQDDLVRGVQLNQKFMTDLLEIHRKIAYFIYADKESQGDYKEVLAYNMSEIDEILTEKLKVFNLNAPASSNHDADYL